LFAVFRIHSAGVIKPRRTKQYFTRSTGVLSIFFPGNRPYFQEKVLIFRVFSGSAGKISQSGAFPAAFIPSFQKEARFFAKISQDGLAEAKLY